MADFWKEGWQRAKDNLTKWWHLKGPAISIMSPKDKPHEDLPAPSRMIPFAQPNAPKLQSPGTGSAGTFPVPEDPEKMWLDPEIRFRAGEYYMANTFYGGEAFPYFDTHLGPGNLSAFIGAKPAYSETDAWFTATMKNLDDAPPFKFDLSNIWFRKQMDIIEYGVKHSRGRFLVSMPDLFDNIDVLAALRGTSEILLDMVINQDAVINRIEEINAVALEVFDRIYSTIKDADNGNCVSVFDIWGHGKTNKVQVDLGAMFSADMFETICMPALSRLCDKLDYVLYHLDGSQCLQHLDHILSIPKVNVIQWTPDPGQPGGGDPKWYPMYRKIKEAGKAVQAIWIKPEEIDPLMNSVGAEGIFLQIRVKNETEARILLDKCEKWYR